jgi:predicted dehydrogenase
MAARSAGGDLRIGFIGAGAVNFGGGEGPWDHAGRLEKIGGVRIVGIADPDTARARKVLAARRKGPASAMYAEAAVDADFRSMIGRTRPDAVFIGVPPAAHAAARPPGDIELVCAAAGVHMFIEKPLAAVPPEKLAPVAEAMRKAARKGLVISVGYMFRYSLAVRKMQEILSRTPGGVRAVVARYNCAYSQILKPEWWDVRQTGGPIVEQATHFCDLARLFGGEVDLPSVQAVAIDPLSEKAALADMPTGADGKRLDHGVAARHQVPRSTAAVWRFKNGAIGSLTHAALLHGAKYESELEVWGDGLRLVLQDPYGRCRLLVRRPHKEKTEVLGDFAADDPYLSEDIAFVDAVRAAAIGSRGKAAGRGREPTDIRSTYADALKTHEFTWAIRRAAEDTGAPAAGRVQSGRS